MSSATFFQIQSFIILALMVYGVTQSKKRKKHIKIMSSAIIWDILLILQIELNRSAIDKALEVFQSQTALKIHLFFAVSSVVLYFAMIISGRKVLAGDRSFIPKHRYLGITTLAFRILTFITSFYAAAKPIIN
ncbi:MULTISPECIES: hypothetical protein [Halobacteriovorax]|uniref:Cytochrome b561 domain-containing protein n=1 Tax=Halobacteriovorax vibrionivorans TaxID=2152716 RepID=A0ABY0IES2_9BACT|nr:MULTISPECIES: hypothetical protein [Halobacteriovorax]AYF45069.1 hypothetical protein BALOs_2070 [Halobacteriovorax sp. BALOs_7]RZF21132.1 hypothetical protein DAY19_14225 [Halobacteriovorax vibrionivorans]TGD46271.1 hypothetical protein EP118_12790 [Halobacteriovorax sp. Y22]